MTQGLLITAADSAACVAGLVPGGVVQRINGKWLGMGVDALERLKVAEMPTAVEVALPQHDEELLVDLTVQSFLLRVDAFRTRPMVLGMDMQVQKAVVKMPEVVARGWKGPLVGLMKQV